jgi:glycosyltransferase involved in cell wall biosynthesis
MAAILLITNYCLDGQQSMLRAADLLESGLRSSGNEVLVVRPEPFFGLFAKGRMELPKWLAYLDKYLLFPFRLMWRARRCMLLHIVDHSNAIYLFWLRSKKSVVTCNDLLAVRSALDEIPEHKTGFAGKLLQKWILGGLRRSVHIVCISEATKLDVLRLTGKAEKEVSTIYLGLGPVFEAELQRRLSEKKDRAANIDSGRNFRMSRNDSRRKAPIFAKPSADMCKSNKASVEKCGPLGAARSAPPGVCPKQSASVRPRIESDKLDNALSLVMFVPYILHVGGDTWYKNRPGVLRIYLEVRRRLGSLAPNLIMVGPTLITQIPEVHFLQNITDSALLDLYRNAALLLFPSLYEGFGWPVVEAHACGCPAVVSAIPALIEAGGNAAAWIQNPYDVNEAAGRVIEVLRDDSLKRQNRQEAGYENACRFSHQTMIAKYLELYATIVR